MNNSFYDDKDLREIDEQISEVIGQPTLVDQMQERNDKAQAAKTNWSNEFRQYWYIYLPLLVSSVFTMMLGLYMGLAPYLRTEADGSKMITFNTDWGHIFTAAVYVVAFVFVTEVAFAIFHNLFHKREDSNGTQQGTMLFGMILAGISIIGTGVSGGMVVSSTLGFLTEFKEIPPSAQRWVVSVIPVMLGLYAGLFTAYKLSSRKAKAERIARENEDKLELDNQVRMRGIQAIGKRRIQAVAIKMYEEMVMRGLLSPTEADWALNSGLTLADIEKKLGRDLTGEGKIGDTSGLQSRSRKPYSEPTNAAGLWPDGLNARPGIRVPEGEYRKLAKKYPNVPGVFTPGSHQFTADELCEMWQKSRAEVGEIFASYNNANHFYSYAEARTDWLSKDMTRENFAQIFDELMMEYSAHPVRSSNNHKDKANP